MVNIFLLLSRKYGLAADSVVDVLLIDADGSYWTRNPWGRRVLGHSRRRRGHLRDCLGVEDPIVESASNRDSAGLPEAKTIGRNSEMFKGLYLGPRSETISILNTAFLELGILEQDCEEMSWIESVVYFSGLGKGSTVFHLKDRYFRDKDYFKAKSDYVRTQYHSTSLNEF
ncbi:hypothetical protein Vadar_033457 [Vaccinium darrowii]|uniref:Uncharacterized protein n=1 Tax=Vaccinium darrowii TaxID=229202 RepID=A0ACB7X673_9ERIC|nr:hypothetical protein Vadar_033457 [Vaccinium darrowii]